MRECLKILVVLGLGVSLVGCSDSGSNNNEEAVRPDLFSLTREQRDQLTDEEVAQDINDSVERFDSDLSPSEEAEELPTTEANPPVVKTIDKKACKKFRKIYKRSVEFLNKGELWAGENPQKLLREKTIRQVQKGTSKMEGQIRSEYLLATDPAEIEELDIALALIQGMRATYDEFVLTGDTALLEIIFGSLSVEYKSALRELIFMNCTGTL